ncbi:MAG: TetR/AcrR family transcriptional regulator [Clostridiales Family XIII bacterium]|nr:TetR/AcrR family transcriptional regulator [Clostridiales Family XIII bacterium]
MNGKTATSRSQRAIKTKGKLFKSAAKLIDKYGYDHVTIEDISREAGVSVGAFYHYYQSKSDVIVEFFMQIDLYFDELRKEIFGSGDAARQTLALFRAYAQFHEDRGFDHTRTILRVQTPFFNDRSRTLYTMLEEIVHGGQAAGVFTSEIDAEQITGHFLIVARGVLFDWVLEKSSYDLLEKMRTEISLSIRTFNPVC